MWPPMPSSRPVLKALRRHQTSFLNRSMAKYNILSSATFQILMKPVMLLEMEPKIKTTRMLLTKRGQIVRTERVQRNLRTRRRTSLTTAN